MDEGWVNEIEMTQMGGGKCGNTATFHISIFVAQLQRLPVIADNCPACFAAPKERHRRFARNTTDQHKTSTFKVYTDILSILAPFSDKPQNESDTHFFNLRPEIQCIGLGS